MAGDDPKRLAWVRGQPCVACGREGPSEAHHHTHRRGLGQRASDVDAMPLCSGCHWDFHNAQGKSAGLTQRERTLLQDGWAWATREAYAHLSDEEVF